MIPAESTWQIEGCGRCPFSGVRAGFKSVDREEARYYGTGCFITAYAPFSEAEQEESWPEREYPRLFRDADLPGEYQRYPSPPPPWCPLRGRRIILVGAPPAHTEAAS